MGVFICSSGTEVCYADVAQDLCDVFHGVERVVVSVLMFRNVYEHNDPVELIEVGARTFHHLCTLS